MKRLIHKPAFAAVVLVIIYLSGLALGACALTVYPVFSRWKNVLLSHARIIAQESLEGSEEMIEKIKGANVHILFYDAEGNCLRYITSDKHRSRTELDGYLERYLHSVLSGDEIFKVTPSQYSKKLTHIWLTTGIPITEQGRVVGAVFLIRNLENLQEALIGYVVYCTLFYWLSVYFLISSLRKKRKLDELRQNYVANVTHAFKTPIASIKALAETLCDGVEPDPERQKVYYGMILREANRQDHMIRDTLELSKLQSNGMDFSKTGVRISEVLDPVVEKYAVLCDCMGISLHISEKIARLPLLHTNAACLKQLLELLLDNALKFAGEDGDIWLEVSVLRDQVTFCGRDNGIGISKEDLPHVFERFFKCSHDFNESGSGLGLAIAREIAAGLKERIWAESEQGQGTAFFFTVHTARAGRLKKR